MRMICKNVAVFLFFFQFIIVNGQTQIKGNTLFLPVGIVNLAIEHSLNKHFSIQEEIFVSPWKSFSGKHLQIYMTTVEGRYYFSETMKKWFVGSYFSVSYYNLQKWNYWEERIVTDEYGIPEYLEDGFIRKTEVFQKGYSFVLGINGGYHFAISQHLGLDVFVGIGTSQGLYKGFFKDNYERADDAKKMNKSGEIIPTRGGLMFTYKL